MILLAFQIIKNFTNGHFYNNEFGIQKIANLAKNFTTIKHLDILQNSRQKQEPLAFRSDCVFMISSFLPSGLIVSLAVLLNPSALVEGSPSPSSCNKSNSISKLEFFSSNLISIYHNDSFKNMIFHKKKI